MLHVLGALYARRVINVNVNIVLAGVLALGPVLVVVTLVEWALHQGLGVAERLAAHQKLVIAAATLVADITFDVAIYYGLHWLANHTPWLKKKRLAQIEAVADAAIQETPFFKDATKVQIERMVLSPLLYILWLGMQQTLMNVVHLSAATATVIGFCVGMASTRAVHTMWMLRQERAAVKKVKEAGARG